MIRVLRVFEHQTIKVGPHVSSDPPMITEAQAHHLRQLEQDHANTVFSWGYHQLTPQQWVGVIEIPGLQIEILPKLDTHQPIAADTVRDNLLQMLRIAGDVPFRERDIAALHTDTSSILDYYIAAFARKLLAAAQKGIIHQYVAQESNKPFLRGKLLLPQQLKHNVLHRERFFVRYDEFSPQNTANRALKATVRRLLRLTRTSDTLKPLRRLTQLFAEIDDSGFRVADFQQIHLSRLHQEYADLLTAARMFWREELPGRAGGATQTFSLLFDMNQVFERFIHNLLLNHQTAIFGSEQYALRKKPQHLFRTADDRGVLSLRPDILIEDTTTGTFPVIIDTKWKRLRTTERNRQYGISREDLYQMYAYAREHDCRDVILLYPEFRADTGPLPVFCNNTDPQRPINLRICTVDLTPRLPQGVAQISDQMRTHLQLSLISANH